MPDLGNPKFNATLTWPGRSQFGLVVEELAHGFNFISNESGARTQKTFYPVIRTSGEWYVQALFYSYKKPSGQILSSHDAYVEFANWMTKYVAAITDPQLVSPKALVLDVPTQGFTKSGFPKGSIEYGDEFGKFVYKYRISFSSASDPINPWAEASKYAPAPKSSVARRFYPGGLQVGQAIEPNEDGSYPTQPLFKIPPISSSIYF